jgi:hypothetical protein
MELEYYILSHLNMMCNPNYSKEEYEHTRECDLITEESYKYQFLYRDGKWCNFNYEETAWEDLDDDEVFIWGEFEDGKAATTKREIDLKNFKRG